MSCSVHSQGHVLSPAQSRKGEAFNGLPAPWAGAASSSTYCASRSPESGAWEGRAARGHGSRRLVAPGVMSWGGVRSSDTPPAPDPAPLLRAEAWVPGGVAQAASRPPQVEGGAGALSVGRELGAETGDPPERA